MRRFATGAAPVRRKPSSWATATLAILAVLAAIHIAKPVLVPLIAAVVLALLLVPAVTTLESFGLRPGLASAIVVLSLILVTALAFERFATPTLRWLDQAPETLITLRQRLRAVQGPVSQISEAAEEVRRITRGADDGEAAQVAVAPLPNLSGWIVGRAWATLSTMVLTAVLVHFLLSYRINLIRKLIRLLSTRARRRAAARMLNSVRREISTHLVTITVINTGLGVAIGFAMWYAGLPSPALWGLMAGLLNFIPYLGALMGVAVVSLVALSTLETLGGVLLVALLYTLLTSIEGLLVTPAIAGRRLRINPVAVLLGVISGGFLWGIPGVLLAVPLLITAKVAAQHHPKGRAIAVVLGR